MLEEQEAWEREDGFDRIEIIAEMDARRFRTGFDLELFYTKIYNPRWLRTPAEYMLKMSVEAERLRMEIVLLQNKPPPQCNSLPRRLLVVGTGLNGPRAPHAKSQSTEREGIFFPQASVDFFLLVCTSPEQGTITLLQADAKVDDDETTTSGQAGCSREICEITEEAAAAKDDSMG